MKILLPKFLAARALCLLLALSALLAGCATERTVFAERGTAFVCPSKPQSEIVRCKTLFIVAMPCEAEFVAKHFGMREIGDGVLYDGRDNAMLITQVGGSAVESALRRIAVSGAVRVVNVGYAGARGVERGSVVRVSSTAKIESPDAPRRLAASGVRGYSADEFVRSSELPEPCVFDMELFYIAEYFPDVESYKIISDTLNRDEYESFSPEASWRKFFEMYNSRAPEN